MRSGAATLPRGKVPSLTLPRFRAPIVFGALLLVFAVLAGRSIHLQWFDNEFLQEQGSARYSRALEVPAHRGRILDRLGEPLAISTPVKSLWVFPAKFEATPAQVGSLAKVLEVNPQVLARKVDSSDDFAYIAKQLSPEVAERAMALKIAGLNEHQEYRRYYPGGETLSHILGFTGDRDVGKEGIELAQQERLGGRRGSRRVIINRRGTRPGISRPFARRLGRDLALAIDTRLQHIAFRELKAVEANKAKAGGLVLDADGRNLAPELAHLQPERATASREAMRNRALTDVFEPGSTLKPFTIAAVLESGRVRPDTVIQTAPGTLTIGPATIHDAHVHGALTVEQVIQKSSNVGAAKIALSLSPETMWHTLSESGFGTAPKTGFPGEVSGRLRPAKTWRPIEQATMAYGHGISVNLVQRAPRCLRAMAN